MQMNAELTTVSEGDSTIHLRERSRGRDKGQRQWTEGLSFLLGKPLRMLVNSVGEHI